MSQGNFVRAKETGHKEVTYWRADGSSVRFIGGSRAWRNQNPGNVISKGNFAKNHGAIGTAGGFAIFPNYETGKAALFSLLKTKEYQSLTIDKVVERYAPKSSNDTRRYKVLVQKFTGLDLNRKLSTLSDDELERLAKAIERIEGQDPGKIIDSQESEKKKISAVRKNKKGVINKYYVAEFGWLSKSEAIELASQGKIDAVVATSRSGNAYLRTRPDQTALNNLEVMG